MPQGLHFRKAIVRISANRLDEDPEGGDELYVDIRVLNRSGATVRSVQTNPVERSF